MDPIRRFLPFLVALTTLLLVTVQCSDDEGAAPAGPADPSGTTRISLLLTDDPDDLAHAWVEITQIYLQGETEDAGDSDMGRVVLLDSSTGLVDLLTLDDKVLELVDGVVVPSGEYGQLRVIVGGAVVETEGGEVFSNGAAHPEGDEATGTVLCPSCTQTGIKVVLGANEDDGFVVEGDEMIVTLDFDVSETFGQRAGESGMWVMRPVITMAEIATAP